MKNNIPIYVVSLSDATERRNKISIMLYGFNFEFIDAIKGSSIDKSVVNKINKRNKYKRPIGVNEIGCSLSHLAVYKLMVSRNQEKAIILEDDAIINIGFNCLFKDDFYLKNNYLYLLGGQEGLRSLPMQKFSIFSKTKLSNVIFKHSVNSEKYLYRTCSYMINLNTAKNLIIEQENEFFLADDWSYLSKVGCVKKILLTSVVSHPIDLVESDIEKERLKFKKIPEFNAKFKYLRTIKSLFRNIYRLGF